MAVDNEEQRFAEQLQRFKEALSKTLGDAIRKPQGRRLGFMDANGATYLNVPQTRSDQPNKYYFHEAGGTTFQGEAFLQPGALASWQIRYGMPIRVRIDPLSGEWEIIGIDSRFAAQFTQGSAQDDGVYIPYEKLAPGMLTQTDPPTMAARVLSAAYDNPNGTGWKWIQTQNTVDWSEAPYNANVPTTPLKARIVLVQLNYATGLLEYIYGTEFPASMPFEQVYTLNTTLGDNSLLPLTQAGRYRCGYIKLINGMDRILRRQHIWTVQQYLGGGSGGGNLDNVIISHDAFIITRGGDAIQVRGS